MRWRSKSLIKLCSPGCRTHGPHGQAPSCFHHVLPVPEEGALLIAAGTHGNPQYLISPSQPLSVERSPPLCEMPPWGQSCSKTAQTSHSPVHPSVGLRASQTA